MMATVYDRSLIVASSLAWARTVAIPWFWRRPEGPGLLAPSSGDGRVRDLKDYFIDYYTAAVYYAPWLV
jgi:hypothetical protein